MSRLRAYSNPTLARLATLAISARQIQLVTAEVSGNHIEVGFILEQIAYYENELAVLATGAIPARGFGIEENEPAHQRCGEGSRSATELQERALARRKTAEEAQTLADAA